MSFSGDVQEFSDEAIRLMGEAVQKIALDTFTETIRNTPVDTGRLRGSWMTAIGAPAAVDPGTLDGSGSVSIARASGVVEGAEAGDVIYMTTSVEYAIYVERGTARMAPRGMVAGAVARAQPVANAVIAQIAARG